MFLTCTALFIAAKQSTTRSKRLGLAWGTIALAILFYTLGDVTWGILEVGLKQQPFPSTRRWLLPGLLSCFPGRCITLPENPTSAGERINKAMDIGIVMVAAILGFWNFLIGPSILSNVGQPWLTQLILLAYPVGDLVLFGALLLIINNRSTSQDDVSLLLLAGALLSTIVADSVFDYQSLQGTYVSGGVMDIGWILSTLLVGLAGIYQITSGKLRKSCRNIPACQ